jgi:hypothetical protein
VPSQIFELEQNTFTFHLRNNVEVLNYSLNKDLLKSIFSEMMEGGSYFLHLKEFSEFMSIPFYSCGLIQENFAISINEFL